MWGVVAVSAAVLLISLWLIGRKKQLSILKELGIPGPEPNILFGNLWELTMEGPLKCHKKWTEQYGRVSGHYFGTKPIILVTDTDLLKKILISDFHKFPNRPNLFDRGGNQSSPVEAEGLQESLLSLRDKRWKEIRSIITSSFTTSKMKLMSTIINKAVDVLLQIIDEKAETKEAFDIYAFYRGLTMDIIGRTAFGIQTDVQRNPNDPFLRTAKIIVGTSITSFMSFISISFPELANFWIFFRRIQQSFKNKGRNPVKELSDLAASVVMMRRKDKSARRNDFLQLMIDAEMSETDLKNVRDQDLIAGGYEKGREKEMNGTTTKKSSKLRLHLTDSEIVHNIVLFLLAGYDTTSTALAFTTHFLIHFPEVQERIREEVKEVVIKEGSLDYTSVQKLQYLDQVICESLRLYPPVHLFVNREVGEDIIFGSMRIKKGLAIQIPTYVLHHDPELWNDPEKFFPERFSPENKSYNQMVWQPFGAGPRNCVGMRFAQMEVKFAFARILQKYRLISTDETEKDPLTLHIAPALMSPENGIKVKAVPL